jgi:hypothetical protein
VVLSARPHVGTRAAATDTLNRQLRAGIDDRHLAELVAALRDDDRLTLAEEEHEQREPRIDPAPRDPARDGAGRPGSKPVTRTAAPGQGPRTPAGPTLAILYVQEYLLYTQRFTWRRSWPIAQNR